MAIFGSWELRMGPFNRTNIGDIGPLLSICAQSGQMAIFGHSEHLGAPGAQMGSYPPFVAS